MNMTEPLRRVLVRRPGGLERWSEYGWRSAPDPAQIQAEHEAFCAALVEAGAEVVVAEPLDGNPDAVYVYDPAIVSDRGAILLRPGKNARQPEVDAMRRELERTGIPIAARLVELRNERQIELVEVPEEEFDSMGCNVLALGPRVALALEENPETRRRMADAGVDVRTYRGEELSRKGDGGPTCLTRPLERG